MACTYMYRYKAWCMVYQNKSTPSTLLYKLKEQNGKKKEKKNKKKDQK